MWHGEAFYGLGVQGFGVLFLLFLFFSFCQVWLQQESIPFGLLKVSQTHLELMAGVPVVQHVGSGSMRVVACLFFQCIVAWRSLPWARDSGY
jgi:hypothetical protein